MLLHSLKPLFRQCSYVEAWLAPSGLSPLLRMVWVCAEGVGVTERGEFTVWKKAAA